MTYADLLRDSASAAAVLRDGAPDLDQRRVAFLTHRDSSYVVAQWGIWRAGGVAVPLCDVHPPPELAHVMHDSRADTVIVHPEFRDRLESIARDAGCRLLEISELTAQPADDPSPPVDDHRRAMIVYTSGTTGRPKGAVTTHGQLTSQIETLASAWGWSAEDRILHVLPLHHVHGIVNVLCCALWSGAVCEMMPRFDADAVWDALGSGRIGVFMAVPTIYARLVQAYDRYPRERQETLSRACREMRLMVSGSAALPVQTLTRWESITGHVLLERYGMTEIGMALSNPLHGSRRPGHVGQPLPGIDVQLVGDDGQPVPVGTAGELWVRGPCVFEGYFGNPEATRKAFTDGWFRTGDVAVLDQGSYRILGRHGVDIIKSGGYKISALEVEAVLRDHPTVSEVAVVGLDDPVWGQRVAAAVVLQCGERLTIDDLQAWGRERLAKYKLPTRLAVVHELPRNAMGKVQKPAVVGLIAP